jgi:hypothetical protein
MAIELVRSFIPFETMVARQHFTCSRFTGVPAQAYSFRMAVAWNARHLAKLAWRAKLSGNEQSQRNGVERNSKDRVGSEFVDVPRHLFTIMTGATLSSSNAAT